MTVLRALWSRLCPPPVRPVAGCEHGVVVHDLGGDPARLDDVVALGVRHARVTYYTADAAHNPAWLGHFAERVAVLQSHGITPCIVVHDFATEADVVPTMRVLRARIPGAVWQVGNEWEWAGGPHPAWANGITGRRYADLMRRVLAACPGQTFVGMGLCFPASSQVAFTRQYLDADGPTLAAWCVHAYGGPHRYAGKATAEAMSRLLQGRMPLWLTEYGCDTAMDEDHAAPVALTLRDAHRWGVSRTYHYCHYGHGDFGLLRSDRTRRPAWHVLHTHLTNNG